jgi:hypothetical protein
MAKPKIQLNDDREPWEQQAKESPQAYQAFSLYRDAGADGSRRSTQKVADRLGKSTQLIHRWCSVYRWVQRCMDWDRHLARQALKAREKEAVEWRKRAAQQVRGKIQSMLLPDIAISAKLQAPNALEELQQLSLSELIALSSRCATGIPNLLRAEAYALGVPESDHGGLLGGDPLANHEDDVLTRTIQEDDDLRAAAANLIQQATVVGSRPRALIAGGVRDSSIAGEVAEPAALDVPVAEDRGVSAP